MSRRKTVVGMGKAKKFVVDGTGRGLPIRAFPDSDTRRCLAAYCHKWGITQKMLEHLYEAHHEVIEGRYHYDGAKKKWYDYSVDSSLEIFDNHRVEMTAFIVLSHCYQKEVRFAKRSEATSRGSLLGATVTSKASCKRGAAHASRSEARCLLKSSLLMQQHRRFAPHRSSLRRCSIRSA